MPSAVQVDRERFLLLAAALAACHQASRQSVVQPAPQDSAPVAVQAAPDARAPAPRPPTFCESLIQQNEAVLAKPNGSCPDYPAQEQTARAELVNQATDSLFRYCHEGKGVWAVVVVSVDLDDAPTGESSGCGWRASYELIYVRDSAATPVKSAPRDWDHHPNSTRESGADAVFDYDGDGKDELLLSTRSWWNGGGGDSTLEVLRADESAVKKFDVRFHYDATVDADRDGRPDLVTSNYFATTCEGMDAIPVNGASILWHSLPNGMFSSSDEVARQWGLWQCPAIAAPSTGDSGYDGCALELSCQRIWGRSSSAILKGAPSITSCANSCIDKAKATEIISAPLPYKPLNVDTPSPLPLRGK